MRCGWIMRLHLTRDNARPGLPDGSAEDVRQDAKRDLAERGNRDEHLAGPDVPRNGGAG